MLLHPAREASRSPQRDLLARLAEMQYERNDIDFRRGTFRVRGDVIDIFPAETRRDGAARRALRRRDRVAHAVRSAHRPAACRRVPRFTVYADEPLRHAARDDAARDRGHQGGAARADRLLPEGRASCSRLQRIEQRTRFDLEMLNELGFCKGIENYSRHLSGRTPGEPPPTLIDYLPHERAHDHRREPRHHPADRRHVQRRPRRARRSWWTTASACPRRSTTGRSSSRSSSA